MTMWTVIANPWLTKNGAVKCFCLFLCVFYLPSCRWSGEVPIASLSNNEHDDSENVTKKKLFGLYLEPHNLSNAGLFSWR